MRGLVLTGLLVSLVGVPTAAHAAVPDCTLYAATSPSSSQSWNGVVREFAGTSCELHVNGTNEGTVIQGGGQERVNFTAQVSDLVEVCVLPAGTCWATTTAGSDPAVKYTPVP